MSEITEFLHNTIYPAVYNDPLRSLAEFNFRATKSRLESNTIHADGEPIQGGAYQVQIYANNIGHIIDHSRESISIVDYISRRDKIEFIEAVRVLAQTYGFPIPGFTPEQLVKHQKKVSLGQSNLKKYKEQLLKVQSAVKGLLDRGFTEEEVKNLEIGLAVNELGFKAALAIPVKKSGVIEGFQYRILDKDIDSKFITSPGLQLVKYLYGTIRPGSNIIVVESALDAELMQLRGIENVVALMGKNIKELQLEQLLKANSIVFALDPDKKHESYPRIIKQLKNLASINVGFADLSADPGELLQEPGTIKEMFLAIEQAVSLPVKAIDLIIEPYRSGGEIGTHIQVKMANEVIECILSIGDKIGRAQARGAADEYFKALHLNTKMIDEQLDIFLFTKEKEMDNDDITGAMATASPLFHRHDFKGGMKILSESMERIAASKVDVKPKTLFDIYQSADNQSLKYKTGYPPLDKVTSFSAQDIVIIGARPSTGKTMFMLNLAIRAARNYPNKKIVILTYEDSEVNLASRCINTLSSTRFEDQRKENEPDRAAVIARLLSTGGLSDADAAITKDLPNLVFIHEKPPLEAIPGIMAQLVDPGECLLFIDYLQAIPINEKFANAKDQMKAAMQLLSYQVAAPLNLPIILGCQLSRHDEKKPRLGHMKESSYIEDIAAHVWGLHQKPTEEKLAIDPDADDALEVEILKNKHGRKGDDFHFKLNLATQTVMDQLVSSNS